MQTALILGANRGIGLGLVRSFLDRGWQVHATARDLGAAAELRALAEEHPDRVALHALDVCDDAAVAALAGALEGTTFDAFIHNAGVYGPRMAGPEEVASEEFARVLRVNSVAPYQTARAFLPRLARPGGRVCFLTSRMGSIADNGSGGSYVYRASKAALNAVGKSLAVDLAGEGIAVALLHPGWVRTDMGGEHAPLSVEESAEGLAEVICGLTPERSGAFLDWSGEEIPW